MPNPRLEILRKIFREGIKSVPKETIESLFKHPGKGIQEVYRRDVRAATLMSKGFDKELAKNPPLFDDFLEAQLLDYYGSDAAAARAITKGLPKKLEDYLGTFTDSGHIYDLPGLYWYKGQEIPAMALPSYHRKGGLIQGLVRPDAIQSNPSFFETIIRKAKLNKEKDFHLLGDYDEIMVQQKPGNVLAKYHDVYRILGLAAALGIDLSQPSNDEKEPPTVEDIW